MNPCRLSLFSPGIADRAHHTHCSFFLNVYIKVIFLCMLSLSSLELWYGYYTHILFNIHSNSENYFSVNHKNLERLKSLISHLSSFFRKNIKNKKCLFQSQVVKAKTCTDFFYYCSVFLHITNIKIHIINFKA